jgi:hypothetical protein
MNSELVEIKKGYELTTLTDGLPEFIKLIKSKVSIDDIDLSKKKGRDEVVANAFKVTKAKTSIALKIDDLIDSKKKEIAPTLKIIDILKESKKTTNKELSDLSKNVRQSVTNWEDEEKERIIAEALRLEAEKIAIKKEQDHEFAILMHEKYCRELADRLAAEKVAEESRQAKIKKERDDREKLIAENAKIEAEEKAAQAEKDKIAVQEKAKRDTKAAKAQAKQAKIDAANAETQRIADVKQAKEDATRREVERQAQVKKDEEEAQKKIERNKKHVGKVRGEIKEHIMKLCKLDEKTAKSVVLALLKTDKVTINY